MSKVDDYTTAGFLKPDTNRANASILTIEISIDNSLIEGGFIELAAMGKGWAMDVPAPQHLINWVKQEGANAAIQVGQAQVAQQAREAFIAQVVDKL